MSGILSGCAVTPSAPASLVLNVAAGSALFGSTTHAVTAGTVTHDAADSTNPRIDIVCAVSDGSLVIAKGTAAAQPVAPAPSGSNLPLAFVFIPAGATQLGDHLISDRRSFVGASQFAAQAHPTDLVDNSGGTASGTIAVIRTDTAAHVAADAANAIAALAAFSKSINDKLVLAGIFT